MSTLHKVKAYFGMAPMDDYDDEYYDDDDRGAGRAGYSRRGERFADDGYERGARYDDRDPRAAREYDDPRGEYDGTGNRWLPGLRRRTALPPPRIRRHAAAVALRRPARLHPRRTGDGPPPDGRTVRGGQPAVEDHHAAPQGLQRGPHHR